MNHLSGNLSAEEVRKSALYQRGDCILIWVNQGEMEQEQLELATLRNRVKTLESALDQCDSKARGGLHYNSLEKARIFLNEICAVVLKTKPAHLSSGSPAMIRDGM